MQPRACRERGWPSPHPPVITGSRSAPRPLHLVSHGCILMTKAESFAVGFQLMNNFIFYSVSFVYGWTPPSSFPAAASRRRRGAKSRCRRRFRRESAANVAGGRLTGRGPRYGLGGGRAAPWRHALPRSHAALVAGGATGLAPGPGQYSKAGGGRHGGLVCYPLRCRAPGSGSAPPHTSYLEGHTGRGVSPPPPPPAPFHCVALRAGQPFLTPVNTRLTRSGRCEAGVGEQLQMPRRASPASRA